MAHLEVDKFDVVFAIARKGIGKGHVSVAEGVLLTKEDLAELEEILSAYVGEKDHLTGVIVDVQRRLEKSSTVD